MARTAVAQVTAATSRVTVAEAPELDDRGRAAGPHRERREGPPEPDQYRRHPLLQPLRQSRQVLRRPAGGSARAARCDWPARLLELDCGNGYTVDADWYFPTETEPDKIIYFQHGAFGRAGLYNITAADLAARNNAIVVAPSITTNFFACDGCTHGGRPDARRGGRPVHR